MEVSRRRSLQKHLEPARPLRRIVHIDSEPKIDAATCAQALEDRWIPQTNIGVEQFFKIFSLQKPKKVGRLCYTREFLVGLATCPQAMKKPEFLPEHPVVLTWAVSWIESLGTTSSCEVERRTRTKCSPLSPPHAKKLSRVSWKKTHTA
ncbi:uncharacterized protein C8orf88 homolog isoform X1 [Solea solea]|uniref:uncharacterized protein C8orf88 homolog isoform X1 n=1 Tax=Solea solea TaxID=90069 RepID=UPI00272AE190|nr:uncharacterized protein C8orf88 homolog isoform X1 [Solea solea]XP_058504508.1 uncharacterized protein C8orf88 homolog isoform X1 [Solea solea]XP_058504509.1 uncharacterized protein C8orf88 homolog isoform X1 [Solea solea]XP_058504510.1 uncharacterized protein C8orf88 homolog isoform X1 [Solea solea]XP_058504511.1 uncharacterized protein C8orf88 homolog isoform X1 [Solea solea]